MNTMMAAPQCTSIRHCQSYSSCISETHNRWKKKSMIRLNRVLGGKPGAGVMVTHWGASKEDHNYSSSKSICIWNGLKSHINIFYSIHCIISNCSSVGKQHNMQQDWWCWVFSSFGLQTGREKINFLSPHVAYFYLISEAIHRNYLKAK